jgi:hypothetical protein
VAERKRQEEEARKKGELSISISHSNIMKALDYVKNTCVSVTHNRRPILPSFPEIPYLKRTVIIIIIIIIIIMITAIVVAVIIIIIIIEVFSFVC